MASLDSTVKTDCGQVVVFHLDQDDKFCLPTKGQQTGVGVYSNPKLPKETLIIFVKNKREALAANTQFMF